MNKQNPLKKHFQQKPNNALAICETLAELEYRLQSFLTNRFKDAKDDSKGKRFTTEMLLFLSEDEKQTFERLVNQMIGCRLWFDYFVGSDRLVAYPKVATSHKVAKCLAFSGLYNFSERMEMK